MIVFAMTGAAGSAGGIAAANLNVLEVLTSLCRRRGRPLTVLSLHEASGDRPACLGPGDTFVGCRGSKARYAATLATHFRTDRLFVFDHVRLAVPMMPAIACGFRAFVVMAHGSESWRRVRPTSRWLFRRARLCITNSRFTLDRMSETFSGFEGRACALGLPPPHAGPGAGRDSPPAETAYRAVDGTTRRLGRRVVLLVGRMDAGEREKGHYELLAVWPDIVREFPDAQLVFAGPGNDRANLAARAARLGIAASVFIPGYLALDALDALYRRCYAFVMPSRQEGFGLVYLEAMNHGKPCIACRGGGAEEVVEDGVSGMLIDNPFELGELRGALRRLLASEALARRLGDGGLRRLGERFTSAHAQARLGRLLAQVLGCD